MPRRDELELRRLSRAKSAPVPQGEALGPEMISFFKQSVQKRQTKLSAVAGSWERLIPEILADHCALEGLYRGSLTVIVDSASHLYELKQLLLAGLERQLLIACRSAGLRKIVLKPGRWYEGDAAPDRRPRF